jgi:Protein of unknown function (DUF2796)
MRARSLILATLLAAAPAFAADTAEQHPAHQHGAASLEISLEGRTLQVALDGPADNLLGFEHAARTEAEKQTLARAEQRLRQPAELFATPPAAQCQAQPPKIEIRLPAAGSSETHSDVEAEWRWECARPEALTHLEVAGLFTAFPRLKELKVQVATAKGQQSAVLRPGAARVKLAS